MSTFKSYLNASSRALACFFSFFFAFLALLAPCIPERAKKRGIELIHFAAATASPGVRGALLDRQGQERVRAPSYVPREARTAKDMATGRGAEEGGAKGQI